MKFRCSVTFGVFAALTLVWMTVIFLFSAQNGEESSSTSERIVAFLCYLLHYTPSPSMHDTMTFAVRKAAHMTEFGILGLLWLGTLQSGFPRLRGPYPAAFAAASIYAATDELHQLLIDGRAGQFTDWLIDSAGILLFLTAVWLLRRFLSEKRAAKERQIQYNQ